jgi:hypothetical protein
MDHDAPPGPAGSELKREARAHPFGQGGSLLRTGCVVNLWPMDHSDHRSHGTYVHSAYGLSGTRSPVPHIPVYLERVDGSHVRNLEYASDDVLARFSDEIRWT